MLTGYQCQVVAFIGKGEFICYDCAHKALDEGQLARSERGIGELSPVSRYSIDESCGELAWEYAGERLRDFTYDHPELVKLIGLTGQRERELIDRWAERHPAHEYCGQCGEVIE